VELGAFDRPEGERLMLRGIGSVIVALLACCVLSEALLSQEPCQVTFPTSSLSVPHVSGEPALDVDPTSATWKNAGTASIVKDCSRQVDYPDLDTRVRGFWTDSSLYLLFACPYRSLNRFPRAASGDDREKLWDRDVVEVFLGDDWKNIRHYREYEIAPTGERVDLAIDLDGGGEGRAWNSGWETGASIDEAAKIWYASARIPLASVSNAKVIPGTRWRMNLYRIDGDGPDSVRRFLCWQPTCVVNRDPNHVPEAFGALVFEPELVQK
jgi:hypothetical protein